MANNSTEFDKKNATRYVDDYDGPTKLIFKPVIARGLIHRNFRLVDIKPDKNNGDKTVFVFADSLDLRDAMQRILRARDNKDKIIDSEE